MKLLLTAIAIGIYSLVAFAEGMMVHDAYIRLLPPSAKTTGAFLELMNHSDKDIKLIKAESDFAKKVEIHNHITKDGMMKMVEVKELVVPAGKTVAMKPGSYHIMLIGLKKPLKENQEAKIKLYFSDKTTQTIKVLVKKISNDKKKGGAHHHH